VAAVSGGPTRSVPVEADHNDLALLNGDALVDAVVAVSRPGRRPVRGRGREVAVGGLLGSASTGTADCLELQ
jgi:hypothetical protein